MEDWRFEIDVMLMSVIYGCRTFIPIFKKQGWGHIVNTASAAGFLSMPEWAPYSATKAVVISLSETLRAELKGSNIIGHVLIYFESESESICVPFSL
jgi:short-subunit dehydrogenase